MPNRLYLDLQWLPAPPADIRKRIAALGDAEQPGHEAQRLAQFALTPNQLDSLGRRLIAHGTSDKPCAPLTPFRLGIVGSGTLDLLVPSLVASAARHGVMLDCVTAPYGQIMQEALDPASTINRAGCDAVLVALTPSDLPLAAQPGDGADSIQPAIALFDQIRDGFHRHGKAICLIQTLPQSPDPLFGNFDRALPGTTRRLLDDLNRALADGLSGSGDVLIDVAAMAETVGLAAWHDPAAWHLAKLPFAARCIPWYADQLGRVIGALRGKARRCLVLDLDNTLWGGVIGDDGVEGLKLGQGDPMGEAFAAIQHYAKALHARGIVLAISSKNDDTIARKAFRTHPEMVLSEDHIAVFQANWTDKASNIRAIAETLSLGLSSLVFLDDNPAERGLVREMLPEVAVPELPADPALYVRTLAAAGYFEATGFSAEDQARSQYYKANATRAAQLNASGGLDDYLASLAMEMVLEPFTPVARERIVQLINKSNQFNLTTRRYTTAQVAEMEGEFPGTTLQVRLRDCHGDNGMISVIIARAQDKDSWEIDTWLMSCRVLGRRVEEMVLIELCRLARKAGIKRLIGSYRPTDRNALVRDHYAKLGFACIATLDDGETRWELDTATPLVPPPIRIVKG